MSRRRCPVVPAVIAAALTVLTPEGGSGASARQPGGPGGETAVNGLLVTTLEDSGKGSLRQAILDAARSPGPDLIAFDSETGPFGEPREILVYTELPALPDGLVIDGYMEGMLWKASGVTVSGGGRQRVFRIPPGASVSIRNLTVAGGRSDSGGGILNEGSLVVKGVTFSDNEAEVNGGGIASVEGRLTVINSTFAGNRAGGSGGGVAAAGGTAVVTNCTFYGNAAAEGGGLFSSGTLLLRNTILAGSGGAKDCFLTGVLDPGSTRNIVTGHEGCGDPVSARDPYLGPLDYYNGPTKTFPLRGGSHAINLGDNGAALDESGEPLKWDQRGNGDPRFVAGYTDIGAFEHQAFPEFVVDTPEDTPLRGCTRSGEGDCPLRGAVELANAAGRETVIRFDPKVFGESGKVELESPLPEIAVDLTIDAGGGTITVVTEGGYFPFTERPPSALTLKGIRVSGRDALEP